MKKVTMIGMGCGPEQLTQEALRAIKKAELILGASRMLDAVPECCLRSGIRVRKEAMYLAEELLQAITVAEEEDICVILSGDTGYYSGAAKLAEKLQAANIVYEILPGISSLQTLSAAIGRPWQNWNLTSAHGRDCDVLAEVGKGKDTFFLTGGTASPAEICEELNRAGLGHLQVWIGENLASDQEQVREMTAEQAACEKFSALSVLLVSAAETAPKRSQGYPDESFLRGQVPMTKQEIRAVLLAKLAVAPEDVCWDIGAGTGSVSIEMAHLGRSVWAVEKKPEALELMELNRTRFCAWNMHSVAGSAPEVLQELPTPDVVFVGGSSGAMEEILTVIYEKNPKARVCVSAIAVETLSRTMEAFQKLGKEPEITQISVSRSKAAGSLHLMMAQNPIWLICAADTSEASS